MNDYFAKMRQGNIVSIADNTGETEDFVVVSQSCDASQPKREFLQLAPLVALQNPTEHRAAIRRENPRFPLVTAGDDELFADLARIASVEKSTVEGAPTAPGACAGDARSEREFSLAIGRWFARFAVPDDVHYWLEPLQTVVREKFEKPESNLGRVLARVVEIRVQADWTERPAQVTLHVIVAASEFPSSADSSDAEVHGGAGPSVASLDAACSQLLAIAERDDKYAAWIRIAEELASRCRPRAKHLGNSLIASAVSRVVPQVWADDDFPLSLVRKSEILDIDFLSDPAPY